MKIIKKVSIVLLFSLLLSMFTPIISASSGKSYNTEDTSKVTDSEMNSTEDSSSISSKRIGITYSCAYDKKQKVININGSVSHEVFVAHRDYIVNLYRIDFNSSLETVLKEDDPLASTAISIKFNFVVDVDNIMDILSQYVVVLVSPSGIPEYIGAELFPSVESEFISNTDRSLYKGIETSSASAALQGAPSVAIVPVIMNKLVSSGHTGYLYSFEDINIFFDKQYIDQLDIFVRNLSSIGAKIYFRLLFEDDENSNGKEYYVPELYSDDLTNKLYAYCDFLSTRYSSYKNGYISGVIIGKSLDDLEGCNYSTVSDVKEYSKLLARYGMTVGLAIRNRIPSADIVYSFSNINSYVGSNAKTINKAYPSDILENLCDYFDEYYSDDFDFSITLESSQTPLNISDLATEKHIDISARADDNYITESNIEIISNYIAYLEGKYESFPQEFMYIWSPAEDLRGNALSCAYSYLYYKLFPTDKLSSFVVSLEEGSDRIYDVLNIVKHIDAQDGWYFTSPLLEFFKITSWAAIIPDFNREDYLHRYHKVVSPISVLPINIAGRFSYFDFTKSSDKTGWFSGSGCSMIDMYNSDSLGRSLCANMNFDAGSSKDYSHLFYSYEYCENFVYTPYVAIKLSIESEKKSSEIFELKISFIDSNNVYEFSQIVYTDEEAYIYVDLSDFSKKYMADYIQFSLRPMGESRGNYKLLISSFEGFSKEHNNDELEKLIFAERLRIRDLAFENEQNAQNDMSVFIPMAVIFVASIIAVMLFFFLRRDDNVGENENK